MITFPFPNLLVVLRNLRVYTELSPQLKAKSPQSGDNASRARGCTHNVNQYRLGTSHLGAFNISVNQRSLKVSSIHCSI